MNSKRYKGMFLSLFGVGLLYLVSFCYGHYMQRAFQSRSILFADEITAAARLHNVSPALITAIIHAESNFNPNARSNAGAKGLMQLMPDTARRFGVEADKKVSLEKKLFDPKINVKTGTRYLRLLIDDYRYRISVIDPAGQLEDYDRNIDGVMRAVEQAVLGAQSHRAREEALEEAQELAHRADALPGRRQLAHDGPPLRARGGLPRARQRVHLGQPAMAVRFTGAPSAA